MCELKQIHAKRCRSVYYSRVLKACVLLFGYSGVSQICSKMSSVQQSAIVEYHASTPTKKLENTLGCGESSINATFQPVKNAQSIEYFNSVSKTHACLVPTDEMESFGTCALVGSAGSLIGSKFGKQIDTHEFVVRFNLAPLDPYQIDVGSFTSMRIFNNAILRESLLTPALLSKFATEGRGTSTKFLVKSPHMFRRAMSAMTDDTNVSANTTELARDLCPTNSSVLEINGLKQTDANGVTRTPFAHLFYQVMHQNLTWDPTSGLLTIAALLPHCKSISLYGYGMHRGHCLHYFEDPEFCEFSTENMLNKINTPHNYLEEKFFLRSLARMTSSCIHVFN